MDFLWMWRRSLSLSHFTYVHKIRNTAWIQQIKHSHSPNSDGVPGHCCWPHVHHMQHRVHLLRSVAASHVLHLPWNLPHNARLTVNCYFLHSSSHLLFLRTAKCTEVFGEKSSTVILASIYIMDIPLNIIVGAASEAILGTDPQVITRHKKMFRN